jgi:hypothetical protein
MPSEMLRQKPVGMLPEEFRHRKIWNRAALITAAATMVLWLMGQPVWCKCGSWIPWSWDIWSSHNSQHLLDPYTATHVLHGVILCGLLYWLPRSVPESTLFLAAIILEAVWEIQENSPFIIERYRESTMSQDYYGDSILNSVFDILACAFGYVIALRLRAVKSVVFSIATELILVFWIRDCLVLNVLMLVWPIDAIKQWQTALMP